MANDYVNQDVGLAPSPDDGDMAGPARGEDPLLAVARLERAARDRPDDPDIGYQLILAYMDAGWIQAARAAASPPRTAGLTQDQRRHIDIELAFRDKAWDRLVALPVPQADIPGPAVDSPWIRVLLGLTEIEDRRGAQLALERFHAIRRNDWNYLDAVIARLELPAQGEFLSHVLHTLINLGLPASRIAALEEAGVPGINFESLKTRADGHDHAISKLAHDWEASVFQLGQLSLDERPDEDTRRATVSALQWALDGQLSDAADRLAGLSAAQTHTFLRERLHEVAILLYRMAGAPGLPRDLIADDGSELVMSPKGDTRRIAIVFTGLAERVSGLPATIFDRLLANAGYQSIFLRDRSRCGFACGIGSLAPNARDTIDILRERIASPDREELLVIGASGGGFSSLHYGIELGADRIIVFSGGTVCLPEDLEAVGDFRVPVIARRTRKRAGPRDFVRPVREVLAGHPAPPDILLHYPSDMAADAGHAHHLAGSPGVRLHAWPNARRHNIMLEALCRFGLTSPSDQA